jgi:hypothetical protein
MSMDFDEITDLRARHPAWILLRSNNAALVLSFLQRAFVDTGASGIPSSTLAELLDDDLYALNQRLGEDTFPKSAASYLDDWAATERGWLRKYYPADSDEAHFDLAPAVERALAWVADLRPRDFVGTESRLNTVVDLLRQIVHGSDTDPAHRLDELKRQRALIDEQIARAERGDIDVLDGVGQRDRYQQFARTARELLADFREVEENFRLLDRHLREQIATWGSSKGELLDEVLGSRNSIAESDQGRSFRAFYDLLLSADRQAELGDLLDRLDHMETIAEYDSRMSRIHFDWIDASERTQGTVRLLSEQLRRFLDDKVWLENRRVVELLRGIETKSLQLRRHAHPEIVMTLDDPKVPVVLPTERPLYRPTRPVPLDDRPVEAGDVDDIDSSALVEQTYVDRTLLRNQVLAALGPRTQVGLDQVVDRSPLEHGLAELVGYLALADPDVEIVYDDDGRVQIGWVSDEHERVADLPRVTFSRRPSETP